MASAAAAPRGPPDTEKWGPETAILFVVVSLFIGTISRQVLNKTKVPYTVALLVFGMGLGALEYGVGNSLGSLGQSIRMWSRIDPNLILYVFLPALLFESSSSMQVHHTKRSLIQMILLAGPGVIISTACLGLVHYFIFPYGWSWSISLLLGGLLSATDPVAVISLLKGVGGCKKLSTIVEGESMMNDGIAMAVFELFRRMALGKQFSAGETIKFMSQVSLGAVALGIAFGSLSVLWLGFMANDYIMEITLTFAASYCVFFIAQDVADLSGILSVMTLGICFAGFARAGESQPNMNQFWSIVEYFASTLVFILSGVIIAESFLRNQSQIEGRDWGYLLLLYLFLQISRAVVVTLLYPGLSYYGYGLTFKEAVVLVSAGLRGPVALTLALSVPENGNDKSLSDNTRTKFVFLTGGVVFLTIVINGPLMQLLLRFMHIEKTTEAKSLILEQVKCEMSRKVMQAFEELGEDEQLVPADWMALHEHISCLSWFPEEERHAQPAPNQDDLRRIYLKDTRMRFLNGLQATYCEMREEARITQIAAIILMQSVDEALDKAANQECLLDWSCLHPHLQFPKYLKQFETRTFCLPEKLWAYLILDHLELGCNIGAAFIRAHVMVRRHIRDIIGDNEVVQTVIRESVNEATEAKQLLENIRLAFSEVVRVVKTKQVVQTILSQLSDYIQSLEKSGLLKEKETMQLLDAVQVEMKNMLILLKKKFRFQDTPRPSLTTSAIPC